MIIGKASVLRRIPTALARHQALFIEGIRFSIQMTDLAHRRLQTTLPLLTKMEDCDEEIPSTVSAMLDAWSMVDSLHRLRGLLNKMPGIEKRNRVPAIRAFFNATDRITELRNTVQHLDTTIPDIVDDKNWAVLGSLSWGLVDPAKNQITSSSFLPGLPLGSRPLINPANRLMWHVPVDAITIERSGVSVCLSDAMRTVESLTKALEKMLSDSFAQQLPDQSHHGADLTVSLVIQVRPEQVLPAGTSEPEPILSPGQDSVAVGKEESSY